MADTPLTDDYVAALLAKDAKAVSQRASLGLGYGSQKSRPANSAKPNTRFLKNILRNTDAHNLALLEKEEEESRKRLRALDPKRKGRQEQQLYSVRARRDQDEVVKRRRVHDGNNSSYGGKTQRERGQGAGRARRADGRRHLEAGPVEHGKESHGRSIERSEGSGNTKESRRGSPADSIRTGAREDTRSKRRRHHRRRSSSPEGRRRDAGAQCTRRISNKDGKEYEPAKRRRRSRSDSSTSEAETGPRRASPTPPAQSRGRGKAFASSTMDEHFRATYDPHADLQPDRDVVDDDDWNQALEALRDRQKWNATGAARLKAAGFSESEIRRWQGGKVDDDANVRWTRKGEAREWDQGKPDTCES